LLSATVMALAAAPVLAHGVSEDEAAMLAGGGIFAYMWSGAVHIVTGYDHLLFLFGVMFFLTTFREIVKFITAFTIGHSITLVSATLLGIKLNYFLIDAVIAVSVIYRGFDNLEGFQKAIGVRAPNLLGMVFGFGLIHGFGLSTQLQRLPLPQEGLVARILAFNVGVELGQIAALAVMVFILRLFRDKKSFGPFTRVANGGLVIAGFLLLLFQLHGYLHTSHPDEFGFAKDEHLHHHEDIDRLRGEVRDTLMPPAAPNQ
jgi:HupE / UreJ protein